MLSEKKAAEMTKRDDKVLAAMKSKKDGIQFRALSEKTKLNDNQLRASLRRLFGKKRFKKTGNGPAVVYTAK